MVRVDLEPVIKEIPNPVTGAPVEVVADQIVRERYVYWEDYRQNPARTFDDVWWVAFRHVMSRQDLRDNKFERATAIPLNWTPDTGDKRPAPDDLKKAEVWEIWDKSRRKRIWVVKGYDKPLRIDDDPYGLEAFFPLPEPLVAVADTQTLVPRPEYFEYRDQAEDLDEIVGRISRLTRALKRRGVYDQAVKELKRLATAGDNQFIPVENWQALASKGGLQAAFQTEDISGIATVLRELYPQRDMLVQGIYELTGMSDIMRGASDPAEPSARSDSRRSSARPASGGGSARSRNGSAISTSSRPRSSPSILSRRSCSEITGIAVSPEIVDVLRSDKLRGYRIDIETDSTVFEDEAALKEQTVEVMTAVGTFMREALPVVQAVPELSPLAFEMLEMGVRQLKRGRALEDVIEQAKQAVLAEGRASPATRATTTAAASAAAARSEGAGRAGEGGHHPGQGAGRHGARRAGDAGAPAGARAEGAGARAQAARSADEAAGGAAAGRAAADRHAWCGRDARGRSDPDAAVTAIVHDDLCHAQRCADREASGAAARRRPLDACHLRHRAVHRPRTERRSPRARRCATTSVPTACARSAPTGPARTRPRVLGSASGAGESEGTVEARLPTMRGS